MFWRKQEVAPNNLGFVGMKMGILEWYGIDHVVVKEIEKILMFGIVL